MSQTERESVYVRVTDRAGNEFICPLEALKDPATATEDELDHCVDDATTQRYPSTIHVREGR
jgi:hypothetical protein